MNEIFAIAKKEFCSFFGSIVGYIVIGIFLLGGALALWFFPSEYNVLDSGYADLSGFFALTPYLFLFLVPAITMKSFAEERQQGTWEMLLSRPISHTQIVSGKALGCWLIVLVALVLSLVWWQSVKYLATPTGNVDSGGFWGAMIGLVWLSVIYTAIGIFSSSTTKNQIFAFVLASTLSFVVFKGFDFVSMLLSGSVSNMVSALGINYHYKSIARGVVDSRDLTYFVAVIILFLFATKVWIGRVVLKK